VEHFYSDIHRVWARHRVTKKTDWRWLLERALESWHEFPIVLYHTDAHEDTPVGVIGRE
jgi:hypothetical protein